MIRVPSTKTLVVFAFLFFLATSILVPEWYPPPIPVIDTNGAVMHRADGKVLLHRDMTQFNREAIPGLICFVIFLILAVWLIVRLFRFFCVRCKNTQP